MFSIKTFWVGFCQKMKFHRLFVRVFVLVIVNNLFNIYVLRTFVYHFYRKVYGVPLSLPCKVYTKRR